jgi:hypothetical protein
MIDLYWDNITNQKEDMGSELLPNEATSLSQNVKDPSLSGAACAGGKKKASTHTGSRLSINLDSDDGDSDLSTTSIQHTMSKKA